MRRSLVWGLIVAIALSIAALWSANVPRVVAAIEPRMHEVIAVSDRVANFPTASPSVPLPGQLPHVDLAAAKRDVFSPYAPPIPSAAPIPIAPPVAAAPQMPQAPTLNLRFLGSMVTPAGQRLVYLARGETVVPAVVGERLEEGYVVSAISAEGISLVYPPLDARAIVPIPQAVQQ